jgi:hypothetical protein
MRRPLNLVHPQLALTHTSEMFQGEAYALSFWTKKCNFEGGMKDQKDFAIYMAYSGTGNRTWSSPFNLSSINKTRECAPSTTPEASTQFSGRPTTHVLLCPSSMLKINLNSYPKISSSVPYVALGSSSCVPKFSSQEEVEKKPQKGKTKKEKLLGRRELNSGLSSDNY